MKDSISSERSDNDQIITENYTKAAEYGRKNLPFGGFSDDFICAIHRTLLEGQTSKKIGAYRTEQNYICHQESGAVVYIPPEPNMVKGAMKDLLMYMNREDDKIRPLVRTAIIHAQFETIHPFEDGNGRVGRILIPLYLYYQKQISEPYFFISDALEKDAATYYRLLTEIRTEKRWNEWVKFFLATVRNQCRKYIKIIDEINAMYKSDKEKITSISNSTTFIKVLDYIYRRPVVSTKFVSKNLEIPIQSVIRYLNELEKCGIIYDDGKRRYKTYAHVKLIQIMNQ